LTEAVKDASRRRETSLAKLRSVAPVSGEEVIVALSPRTSGILRDFAYHGRNCDPEDIVEVMVEHLVSACKADSNLLLSFVADANDHHEAKKRVITDIIPA
jgi:hypothetical protein